MELVRCFDRILQEGVHLLFRGGNRVTGGHLQKEGSKRAIGNMLCIIKYI